MSTPEDRRFYTSKAWRKARRAALLRAGFKSVVDGADVSGKGAAQVDHIRPRKEYPELALEPLNLRVMTTGQHNQRHARADYDTARQGCDESGWPRGPDHPWNARRR